MNALNTATIICTYIVPWFLLGLGIGVTIMAWYAKKLIWELKEKFKNAK